MIRRCVHTDIGEMFTIINDAAAAYKGIFPEDRWHEPYMSREELEQEIDSGVEFWGYEDEGVLTGIMGSQDKGPVSLIRHAYVRTQARHQGIGTRLLHHLEQQTHKPILIGTWLAATWAIRFYERNGYRALEQDETERLLRTFWSIPERQIVTSVVLASPTFPVQRH